MIFVFWIWLEAFFWRKDYSHTKLTLVAACCILTVRENELHELGLEVIST